MVSTSKNNLCIILQLVVAAAAAVAAQTSDSIDEQPSSPTLLTSAQLRACLTLREMLQLGKRIV